MLMLKGNVCKSFYVRLENDEKREELSTKKRIRINNYSKISLTTCHRFKCWTIHMHFFDTSQNNW